VLYIQKADELLEIDFIDHDLLTGYVALVRAELFQVTTYIVVLAKLSIQAHEHFGP
jgi:hypothetical protein